MPKTHATMLNFRNELFWKMVWKYSPALEGFDPIAIRANAESPSALFTKLNAHGPAGTGSAADPSKLSGTAKRVLHINATLMDDTFIYLCALTTLLKDLVGAVNVQYAPPKGLSRSEEKIVDASKGGYKGDAMLLKDQVRCTIVCKQPLQEIQQVVFRVCNDVNGIQLVKSNLDAHRKSVGYSDLNNVVKFPNEMFAEIQVNSLIGLYGKNSKSAWIGATRQDTPAYLRLSNQMGIQGGFGHKLYEIARNPKVPKETQRQANEYAKQYYGHIMSNGIRPVPPELQRKMKEFIEKYLGKGDAAEEHGGPSYNTESEFHIAMYELMKEQYKASKDSRWSSAPFLADRF